MSPDVATASSASRLFREIAEGRDARQLHLLGALACERRLAMAQLERLAAEYGDDQPAFPMKSWVDAGVRAGLLVDAGVAYTVVSTRTPGAERAFALASAYRPLVLREVAERGELERVRGEARELVGPTSHAEFMAALYAGDLAALEPAVARLKGRLPPGEEAAFARNALRESVCVAFDSKVFERTWRDAALLVAEQVLGDALFALDPVEGLYAWALGHLPSEDAAPRLVQVLCEQALLRADTKVVFDLARRLPTAQQLAFNAAGRYVAGDLLSARRLLDEAVAFREKGKLAVPHVASASPLLALIALGGDPTEGADLAKRLVRPPNEAAPALRGFSSLSPAGSAARGLRTLTRSLKQPDSLEPQPSAHQLGVHAGAWEIFILALSAHLHSEASVGRAAWARRLSLSAQRFQAAGYGWFARQSQLLARALDERAVSGVDTGVELARSELSLTDLIQTRPEWRKSLDALIAFSEQATRSEKTSVGQRAAFFVDMVTGELQKPVLEEFRSESGWTRGRRVELSELWDAQQALPAEDRALLQHTELSAGRRVWSADAREALCGHPRVFNGARGRLPVEVVRGTCRVEVRREHGHLLIEVEPRGAVEGINVVVDGEARLLVYRVSAQLAELFRVLPLGLRVPESHQTEALGVLARLADHVEVRSAELDAHRRVAADSTPCLRISTESGAFWLELGVRPFGAQGRFFPPGLGRAKVSSYDGADLLDAERDLEEERRRCQALIESCPAFGEARALELAARPELSEAPFSFGLGEEALLELLTQLRESAVPCEIEWQGTRPQVARGRLGASALKGALRRIKGWYIVKGQIEIDAVTSFDFGALLDLPYTKSGRFLRLPSGDFVELEQRVRRVLSLLRAQAERPSGPTAAELRIPDAAFASLRELAESESGFTIDASVNEWHERVDSVLARDHAPPPALLATLRSYQIEGYQWLCRASELGLGVCLADDMGLGKTLQILGLFLQRRLGGPALVVAPTSVCSNWLDEIARFAPSLLAVEYTGKQRASLLERIRTRNEANPKEPSPDVVIVSYALLQQDAAELASVDFHTAVLDEAQFIKNANSLRAKAAFSLNAHYRVAMTGTPVENHLGDLFSIFRFLNEGLLGSWKHFQLRYMRPIERDGESQQREALKRLIQPFLLRRTKDQVLRELPPVTTLRHEVRLSEEEALRYGLLRRQIHEKLRTPAGKREHKLRVFAEITRLRRFCCHPRLVFPEASHECSKIQTFLELVEELTENGHLALVFSQFVDFLDLVREQLDERKISYLYLDGSTPKAARGARVAAFQAGEAPLFLVSLKAGGFGLNLTAADYVIHLDPWWNPAVESQATDRAHRIGQERPVTVYRLVTKDTIEEQIVELHKEKRALAEALLDGTDVASRLDADELQALLGAGL
ncbi:MAG TPA: DEAD/DEAH box helicase [Polyangiaceae bacterium]|nr:DEAD/DEAH box helicase [Polyangiaceae bacterium]